MQPITASLTGLVGQVTLKIEDLACAADLLGDELASQPSCCYVVGLHQTDEVASGRCGVDREHWNASGIRRLDTRHDARRIDRSEDDAVVLLSDGGLHLTNLVCHAAGGW